MSGIPRSDEINLDGVNETFNMPRFMELLRNQIINPYFEIKQNLESELTIMGYAIPINSNQIPLIYLPHLINNMTTCYEVLNNYSLFWATMEPVDFIRQIDRDIVPRLIEIQKLFYIYSVSIVEYVAVEYGNQNISKLNRDPAKQFRFLEQVIKASPFLSRDEIVLWNGLIYLRNKIVHSDSISDKDLVVEYPGLKLEFNKSQRIQTSPRATVIITDWMREKFKQWVLTMYSL